MPGIHFCLNIRQYQSFIINNIRTSYCITYFSGRNIYPAASAITLCSWTEKFLIILSFHLTHMQQCLNNQLCWATLYNYSLLTQHHINSMYDAVLEMHWQGWGLAVNKLAGPSWFCHFERSCTTLLLLWLIPAHCVMLGSSEWSSFS